MWYPADFPDPGPEEDRLLILFDLNRTLLYRPWNGAVVENPFAHASSLPLGPTGIQLTMYHRPYLSELMLDMLQRSCDWGFCTSSMRDNAHAMLRILMMRALGLDELIDRGHRLELRGLDLDSQSRSGRVWLFDASYCDNDGGNPRPFKLEGICEVTGFAPNNVFIVSAVERSCRQCAPHWIPCAPFTDEGVQDPWEWGLQDLRGRIAQLVEYPPHRSDLLRRWRTTGASL